MFHNEIAYHLGSINTFIEKKVSCATWNTVFMVPYEYTIWTVIVIFFKASKNPAVIFALEKQVSGFVQSIMFSYKFEFQIIFYCL